MWVHHPSPCAHRFEGRRPPAARTGAGCVLTGMLQMMLVCTSLTALTGCGVCAKSVSAVTQLPLIVGQCTTREEAMRGRAREGREARQK